jgi:hypothetical protein
VTVDGTLIRTDRCHAADPTARSDRTDARVDLWWSGKHTAHGGNLQIIAALDGWPIRPVFTHRPPGALDHTVDESSASDIRAPGGGCGRRGLGCVQRDRYRALGAAAARAVRCARGVGRKRRAQPDTVRATECSPRTKGNRR